MSYQSVAPFRTLELRATHWYNANAFERLATRAAAARGAGPESARVFGVGSGGTGSGGWGQHGWRIWWEPPARWREEVTQPGGQPVVAVVRDGAGLVYLPAQRTLYTSEHLAPNDRWEWAPAPNGIVELPTIANRLAQFPLIRPPLPAPAWAFETVGEGEVYAGRVTRRVRATRRVDAVGTADVEASGGWPWPWLHRYECLVDDALQVLLSLTGIANGARVVTVAADDVRVDAPFPADVFAFTPPPGTRIVHVPGSI